MNIYSILFIIMNLAIVVIGFKFSLKLTGKCYLIMRYILLSPSLISLYYLWVMVAGVKHLMIIDMVIVSIFLIIYLLVLLELNKIVQMITHRQYSDKRLVER